jgi:hypothetical protein
MTENRTNRTNRTNGPAVPATASAERLGEFPLGSLQSRSAARSLIEARGVSEEEGMIVVIRHIGSPDPPDRTQCICHKRVPPGETRVCHHNW